jgi:hypothetical protein
MKKSGDVGLWARAEKSASSQTRIEPSEAITKGARVMKNKKERI